MDDLGFDDAAPTGGADTSPPTASLTAPANGAVVAGSVALSANAADNLAVDHVDFLVDGSVVGSASDRPLHIQLELALGGKRPNHTVRARAVDTSGNTTTTSTVTVTVANSSTNSAPEPVARDGVRQHSDVLAPRWVWNEQLRLDSLADAHTGSFGEKLDVTSLHQRRPQAVNSRTRKLRTRGGAGHTYTITAWYKSTSLAPIFFAYYRNSSGAWVYWTQSARFAAAANWTQASWSTPPVPAGATRSRSAWGSSPSAR